MRTIILLFFLFSCLISQAQVKAFPKATPYPYLFFTPSEVNQQKKRPLIIFLHGKSLSGRNLKKLYQYGPVYAMRKGLHLPCYLVEPQTPMGSSWNPAKINQLLNKLIKLYPKIDTNRIYVIGMSLGGFGTMDYCGKYWYRVAAGIAMCGGGQGRDACNLSKIPFWIMHGKQDRAVPFDRSMQMAEAITQCNPFHRLFFDEHETFGHGEYARAFNKPELYEWLFQHRKNDSSLYILADHYIDIYPKAFSTHYTVPNEPGLYREADEEGGIPLEDSIVFIEEQVSFEAPKKPKTTIDKPKIPTPKKSVYIVKSGDNLSVIAKKTGVPLSKLKALNGNGKLKPGQKIRLK